jgi:endonuclease/exonuclease/phosphatase (EEP) superfamily protein YafD
MDISTIAVVAVTLMAVTSYLIRAHRNAASGGTLLALAYDAGPLLIALGAIYAIFSGFGIVSPILVGVTLVGGALVTRFCRLHPLRVVAGAQMEAGVPAQILNVVCANVYVNNRTPDSLASGLLATDADIIIVSEWNSGFAAALQRAGGDRYPHRIYDLDDDSDYSVCIVSREQLLPGSGMGKLGSLTVAHAIVIVGGIPIHIYGVNPTALVECKGYAAWKSQMKALRLRLPSLPRPFLIAGDFNTTRHRPEFRALLGSGTIDALAITGLQRTPSFKFAATGLLSVSGPVVRLDHALVSEDVRPISSRNLDSGGSDHLPFLLSLALPRRKPVSS